MSMVPTRPVLPIALICLCFVLSAGVTSVCSVLCATAASAQTAPSSNNPQSSARANVEALTDQQKEEFRTKMLRKAPPGSGCFEAVPGNENWNPVQCLPAPKFPAPLARRTVTRLNVGDGMGDIAEVAGKISAVTGSFDSVTGVTAIYSPIGEDTTKTVYPNTYMFQINSNQFSTKATSACSNVSTCNGWEQFIFSQRSDCGGPCVYIEYWIFNSPSCPENGALGKGCTCPPGTPFTPYYDPTGKTGSGCTFNTPATGNTPSNPFPPPAISDLGKLKFSAQANSNGMDVVTLQTADGRLHANSYAATTINLSQGWTGAEFNIFGDCCAYPVFLNTGSNLAVRVDTTSTKAPTCFLSVPPNSVFSGSTAETNNLSLVSNSCARATPSDIVFVENGGGNPTAAGYSIGDPHLGTVWGLHYDLQGSGDFVLVQAGPNFIVQSRHKPANPSVSVNTAVATKMGNTKVAICLPAQVEVNGKPVTIADNKSIAFDDVLLSRKANVYEILGPGAATVRAELNTASINVYISPGSIDRETVRGLLGATIGHTLNLVTSDGTVLPNPPPFADFTRYADSWRVKPADTLLCPAGKVTSGMPAKPISASDLDPNERALARSTCTAAHVKEGPLLDDCSLDVSILGNQGWVTEPFAAAPTPVKQITPTFP